ncbi:MAG: hypothetical protein PF447_06390, partial [Spirochaetaceae bacterium]|nr:hypothetical protein [Spirochaetaceae bacterium]
LIMGSWTAGIVSIGPSLSDYYHTFSRDIFVGVLVVIGVFLVTYKGYDKWDKVITLSSGIFMICIAVFPCFNGERTNYLFQFLNPRVTGYIHDTSAAFAFSLLGVMSFFQFTKAGALMSVNKKRRNIIYRVCGIIIWLTVLLMIFLNSTPLFIWLESLVLWAFAFSWLIKGQALLKD